MQTKKSQPLSQRIMLETRLTLFPALSVYPRCGISRSASKANDKILFMTHVKEGHSASKNGSQYGRVPNFIQLSQKPVPLVPFRSFVYFRLFSLEKM